MKKFALVPVWGWVAIAVFLCIMASLVVPVVDTVTFISSSGTDSAE